MPRREPPPTDYAIVDSVEAARHNAWQDWMIWLLRRRRQSGTIVVATDYDAVGASITAIADQTLTVSANAVVAFDTATFDSVGFADLASDRLIVPADYAGVYLITGQMEVADAGDANQNFSAALRVNADRWVCKFSQPKTGGGGGDNTLCLSTIYPLDEGDYVQMIAWSDGSGTPKVKATSLSPQLSIVRVGPYVGDAPVAP